MHVLIYCFPRKVTEFSLLARSQGAMQSLLLRLMTLCTHYQRNWTLSKELPSASHILLRTELCSTGTNAVNYTTNNNTATTKEGSMNCFSSYHLLIILGYHLVTIKLL